MLVTEHTSVSTCGRVHWTQCVSSETGHPWFFNGRTESWQRQGDGRPSALLVGGHQFKGASEVLILWDMNSNVGGYPKEAVKCKEKRMSGYVHLRNFT